MICVILLKNNKWYICETNSFDDLLNSYANQKIIPKYMQEHKPMYLYQTYNNLCIKLHKLDDIILRFMIIFGIDNVRGGRYEDPNLSNTQKKELETKINTYPKCPVCNDKKHGLGGIMKCPKWKRPNIANIELKCKVCMRCSKPGHHCSVCYSNMEKGTLRSKTRNELILKLLNKTTQIEKSIDNIGEPKDDKKILPNIGGGIKGMMFKSLFS